MRTHRYLIVISFLFIVSYAKANSFHSIHYTLTPHIEAQMPILKIRAEFKGIFDGPISFDFPALREDVDYISRVRNIKLEGPVGILRPLYNQQIVTVIDAPEIILSYEIHPKLDLTANPLEVILRHDFIHSPGHGLFCFPSDLKDHSPVPVTATWNNLPPSWNTLSSHGNGPLLQFKATSTTLLNAFYSAGPTRMIHLSDTQGNPVHLSLYGKFDLSDGNLENLLNQIISTHRDFSKDIRVPYYAISLIESEDLNYSEAKPLTNGLIATIPQLTPKPMVFLLIEKALLKSWLEDKIKQKYTGNRHNWFFKGFATYYAQVLGLRCGALTLEEFIYGCNFILKSYYLSPLKKEPYDHIEPNSFDDQDYENLPIVRGFVFALYLDALIQKTNPGCSLEDALRHILAPQAVDKSLLNRADYGLRFVLSKELCKDLFDPILSGKTIKFSEFFKMLPFQKIGQGRFDLGFDFEVLKKTGVITHLNPTSNAARQGIKEGMKVNGWDIFPEDPDGIAKIYISSKLYTFKPESPEMHTVNCFKEQLSLKERLNVRNFFGVK